MRPWQPGSPSRILPFCTKAARLPSSPRAGLHCCDAIDRYTDFHRRWFSPEPAVFRNRPDRAEGGIIGARRDLDKIDHSRQITAFSRISQVAGDCPTHWPIFPRQLAGEDLPGGKRWQAPFAGELTDTPLGGGVSESWPPARNLPRFRRFM